MLDAAYLVVYFRSRGSLFNVADDLVGLPVEIPLDILLGIVGILLARRGRQNEAQIAGLGGHPAAVASKILVYGIADVTLALGLFFLLLTLVLG